MLEGTEPRICNNERAGVELLLLDRDTGKYHPRIDGRGELMGGGGGMVWKQMDSKSGPGILDW